MTALTDNQRQAIRASRDAYEAGMAEASALEASRRAAFLRTVEEARAAGATNQEIGDVLGVTRQRVSQLLKGTQDN